MARSELTPGRLAQIACAAEVCAAKAGNVHPGAAFEDVTWVEFMTSALVIEPILDRVSEIGVGRAVWECVKATRDAVGVNTNLGMVLLLAPLCAVPREQDMHTGIAQVLCALDSEDAGYVYDAIRLASPGGIGVVKDGDVSAPPASSLMQAMRWAQDRDAVARQYTTSFADVMERLTPALVTRCVKGQSVDTAIVGCHLEQLAHEPDSLIVRKCGMKTALQAQRMAADVLDAGWSSGEASKTRFDELDRYLRADGHRRNPGTSADLVTAALYVALREGSITHPLVWASACQGSGSCG
ncbi:MAG: triphosphoribosyl-dephospho-CoA synthetase [Phycisphaera sp.]|nr:triphosphoribosyl-dephospho-CoA synthetase [Phycisphaera sp.]